MSILVTRRIAYRPPLMAGLLVCVATLAARAAPTIEQSRNTTNGPCSPVVGPSASNVSITCSGVDPKRLADIVTILNKLVESNADLKEIAKNVGEALASIKALDDRDRQDKATQKRATVAALIETAKNCDKNIFEFQENVREYVEKPMLDGMDSPMQFFRGVDGIDEANSALKDAVSSQMPGLESSDADELGSAATLLNKSREHLMFTSIPFSVDFSMLQGSIHAMANPQSPEARFMRKSDQEIRADKIKIEADKSRFLKEADLYVRQAEGVCNIIKEIRQKLPW